MSNWYRNNTERAVNIAAHTLTWGYIFLSPLFFMRHEGEMSWHFFFWQLSMPVGAFVVFYLNYLVLVPRFILDGKNIKWFVVLNVLAMLLTSVCVEACMVQHIMLGARGPRPVHTPPRNLTPHVFFAIRNLFSFVGVAAIALMLRLSLRWRQSEQARSEAELRHLKSQINPHFLLNTLNNIYALTAFDVAKSQEAIIALGNMLRYMLYEDTCGKVKLQREVEFLQTYISLMKLRLGTNCEVVFQTDFTEGADPEVAPLIFISLVENAFKHGVHSTEPCFIHIFLEADEGHVRFECRNSNFPKSSETDKQPGGIGLHQVARRLNLAYQGDAHHWTYGVEGDVYITRLELKV